MLLLFFMFFWGILIMSIANPSLFPSQYNCHNMFWHMDIMDFISMFVCYPHTTPHLHPVTITRREEKQWKKSNSSFGNCSRMWRKIWVRELKGMYVGREFLKDIKEYVLLATKKLINLNDTQQNWIRKLWKWKIQKTHTQFYTIKKREQ